MDAQFARALIADHLAVDVDAVRDEASFASDLGADSLDVIELAMRFEEALNVSIDDYETESLRDGPRCARPHPQQDNDKGGCLKQGAIKR